MRDSQSPILHSSKDNAVQDIFVLIADNFAYMDSRIDPPSSIHSMTEAGIRSHCVTGEVWSMGDPLYACMLLTPKEDCLYIGKMVIDLKQRGQGLSRSLINLASERARFYQLDCLELETRIELIENHAVFEKLGFIKTGETAHEGYNRPTSITMRKYLK